MILNNLVGISLEQITPDQHTIKRLIAAAERNIVDSRIPDLSTENRFDTAYKAIMQIANAALQVNGYRTLTSKPGHHQTMIQSLTKTIGVNQETVIILDTMRKQRNVSDYSGDTISETVMNNCILHAEKLLKHFNDWLSKQTNSR